MTKTAQIRMIREQFERIPRDLEKDFWFSDARTKLFRACEAAERKHRSHSWCPGLGHHPRVRFTVVDAARYFTVRWLLDYARKPESMPTVKDYGHILSECFLAASIVLNFPDEIRAWARDVPIAFEGIDYVALMQPESEAA